jgi:hypothetical protein
VTAVRRLARTRAALGAVVLLRALLWGAALAAGCCSRRVRCPARGPRRRRRSRWQRGSRWRRGSAPGPGGRSPHGASHSGWSAARRASTTRSSPSPTAGRSGPLRRPARVARRRGALGKGGGARCRPRAAPPGGARRGAGRPRAAAVGAGGATRAAGGGAGVAGRAAATPAASALASLRATVTPPAYARRAVRELRDPGTVRELVGATVVLRGPTPGTRLRARVGDRALAPAADRDGWRLAVAMPARAAALALTDGDRTRIVVLEPQPDSAPAVQLLAPTRDSVFRDPRGPRRARRRRERRRGARAWRLRVHRELGQRRELHLPLGRLGDRAFGGARASRLAATADPARPWASRPATWCTCARWRRRQHRLRARRWARRRRARCAWRAPASTTRSRSRPPPRPPWTSRS